ncbi:MAG: SpoIIE family protein phosphatase [Candidatus Aminicenantales bacterium]
MKFSVKMDEKGKKQGKEEMSQLFIYPPKEGEEFSYPVQKEKITIGRSEENDIPIHDPFSSGKHAFIIRSGDKYLIQDNNSKNGTFLNGKRVKGKVELHRGDEILIGSTRIVFGQELATKVEVVEEPAAEKKVNTMIQLSEILHKTEVDTTLKATSLTPLDIERIKAEYRAYSVLSEVSRALIFHKPLDELLEHIMDLICQNLPMDRGVLMLKEGHPSQLIPKVIRVNNKELEKKKFRVSRSIVNMALEKNSSILTHDAQSDTRFASQESILKMNIHSAMCVPLWNNREIIGIVYTDRIALLDRFTDNDLKLLTLLSNLAAVKIENAKLFEDAIEKEKMEKELALAAQIQKDFLPRENPVWEHFEIAGANIPCHQVGGDYYDFIDIVPCRQGIVIADVSGKGVSASLLMASLRAALYSEVSPDYTLENMVVKLNEFVHRSSDPSRFITFFYCDLNRENGLMRYVNAGHNPPLILDRKGKVHRLEPCGLCLGMLPGSTYEIKEHALDVGDLMILFTDGITESRNNKDEEFEEKRLLDILKKSSKLSAPEILDRIFEEVSSFTRSAPQSDDQTVVIIKRKS